MRNGSIVQVADNSGPILIKIIKIFNACSLNSVKIGGQILVWVHRHNQHRILNYKRVHFYTLHYQIPNKMGINKTSKCYLNNYKSSYVGILNSKRHYNISVYKTVKNLFMKSSAPHDNRNMRRILTVINLHNTRLVGRKNFLKHN